MEQVIPKFENLMKLTKDQLAWKLSRALRDWGNEVTVIDAANTELYNKTEVLTAERDELQRNLDKTIQWAEMLEHAWLQRTKGELIDGDMKMKVQQARIYAETILQNAKNKHFGQGMEAL